MKNKDIIDFTFSSGSSLTFHFYLVGSGCKHGCLS